MVNSELVVFAVGGVVALGTALYYLLFSDNKNQPHNQNPRNPPPPKFLPPPPSPPPKNIGSNKSDSLRKRNNFDLKDVRDIGKAPNRDERSDKDDNQTRNLAVISPPSSPPPEMRGNNKYQSPCESSDSEPENNEAIGEGSISDERPNGEFRYCDVCGNIANARFIPCGHTFFCSTHVLAYLKIGFEYRKLPVCPVIGCRKIIRDFKEIL